MSKEPGPPDDEGFIPGVRTGPKTEEVVTNFVYVKAREIGSTPANPLAAPTFDCPITGQIRTLADCAHCPRRIGWCLSSGAGELAMICCREVGVSAADSVASALAEATEAKLPLATLHGASPATVPPRFTRSAPGWTRWLLRNESGADRAVRIALGSTLLSFVFVGPRTLWGLLGLFPLATGVFGFCPLYRLFRFESRSNHHTR